MTKLDAPYSFDLPQPSMAVADAIHHWLAYLRFLPSAGPKRPELCAGVEREYHHITRKLQSQYHDNELDESNLYDYHAGKAMEEQHLPALNPTRRGVIKSIHYHHFKIPRILYDYRLSEEKLHSELRAGYLNLAVMICPQKN